MKKLIIATVAVACTVAVHAATVAWNSGALYTAADKTGGWSTTTAMSASALVTMSVYLVDETTYNQVSAMNQKGMYDWAETQTATYTGVNKNANTGAFIGAASISDSTLTGSTTYYSIITAKYTDTTYGNMYMATASSVTTFASGTKTLSNIFGGAGSASSGGVRNWQPVPEPTSAMLLMLGLCGLALKRKNA